MELNNFCNYGVSRKILLLEPNYNNKYPPMGLNYMGCELDEDYFRMATERLEAHKAQMRLF